jgi:hypothetical protein
MANGIKTGNPGGASTRSGARRSKRILLAIIGMILCIILAVGLVLQEGGRVVQVDSRGHLYSPILRDMMGNHQPQPNSAGQPGAPSGE